MGEGREKEQGDEMSVRERGREGERKIHKEPM